MMPVSSDHPAARRRFGLLTLSCALPLLTLALLLAGCAGGGATPKPLWRDRLANAQTYPPLLQIAGPRVLVETDNPDRLIALDLATGQRLWEQPFATASGNQWLASDERILYIPPVAEGAGAQSVVALDAAAGTVAWRFDEMQVDDTLLLRGGFLFILDVQGRLLCLDAASGGIISRYPGVPAAEVGEAGADAIQMAITAEAFYLLSPAGVLRTYNIPQATLTGRVNLQLEGVPTALAVQAGRAFVRTQIAEKQLQPKLHVFDLATGQLLWAAFDVGPLQEVVESGGRGYALVSRPNYNDVVAGLIVFDLESGQQLQAVDALGRAYWLSADGRLITYSAAGQLSAHDLSTGQPLWRARSDSDGVQEIGGQGQVAYLIASHKPALSVTANIDRFEVFDLQNGQLLWRLEAWVRAAPAPAGVVVAGAGQVALYPFAR